MADTAGNDGKKVGRRNRAIRAHEHLRGVKNELRDQVCRPPKYPGKPEQYTYVLTESCRPKNKNTNGRSGRTSADKTVKKATAQYDVEGIKKEISAIERALRLEYPKGYKDVHLKPYTVRAVIGFFRQMIDPANRARTVDPLERLKEISENTRRKYDLPAKSAMLNKLPRYTILNLTLTHLKTLLLD